MIHKIIHIRYEMETIQEHVNDHLNIFNGANLTSFNVWCQKLTDLTLFVT
jgi:hypothetical protein